MRLVDADVCGKYLNAIACSQIEKMPTIQAEPIRYGNCEIVLDKNGGKYHVCSLCKKDILPNFKFCCHCGGKLK